MKVMVQMGSKRVGGGVLGFEQDLFEHWLYFRPIVVAEIVGFSSKPETSKIPLDELLSYHYIEWHLKWLRTL